MVVWHLNFRNWFPKPYSTSSKEQQRLENSWNTPLQLCIWELSPMIPDRCLLLFPRCLASHLLTTTDRNTSPQTEETRVQFLCETDVCSCWCPGRARRVKPHYITLGAQSLPMVRPAQFLWWLGVCHKSAMRQFWATSGWVPLREHTTKTFLPAIRHLPPHLL